MPGEQGLERVYVSIQNLANDFIILGPERAIPHFHGSPEYSMGDLLSDF
jgi:hypothetical protein